MQLTDERLKSLRQHADEMAAHGWKDDAETIYALLAAHSAGAQEPVAWRYRTPTGWHATPKIDKALRVRAYHDVQPLYTKPQPTTASTGAQTHKIIDDGEVTGYVVPSVAAHPQPMMQTDAARDVLKSALKALKIALPHMQCDERGNGPDCTPVIQAMMDCGHALAEIERLDGAKGE